jgi:Protein of unknown function (DUF3606)
MKLARSAARRLGIRSSNIAANLGCRRKSRIRIKRGSDAETEKTRMAKQTKRGRKQDRARVAGKQDYEVRYETKKTGKSKAKVKRARQVRLAKKWNAPSGK